MAFVPEHLLGTLKALPAVDHYLVGFSGGLDSTVLLHALTQGRARASLAFSAVHVNHGLQPQADVWAAHCRRVCEAWNVPFKLRQIEAHPIRVESPEAAARQARYAALRELAVEGTCLLTAHQQDDQAETVLLQLLRGSGPAGLAAMPAVVAFGKGWHARPLLEFTRAELADYAAYHGLSWIDDPSNTATAADRNLLRHEVMPRLRARWPAVARTLSRAAGLQAETTALSAALAHQDLALLGGSRPDTLSIARLNKLSPARQRNAIRHWLIERSLPVLTQRKLEHVLNDVISARWDSVPLVTWPGAEVRRYRDDLYAMQPLPVHDPAIVLCWDPHGPLRIPHLDITLEPSILAALKIDGTTTTPVVTVRFRRGGERCRPAGCKHHRELKKLFQEAGVPPWERDRIPLIYAGARLVAVIGYWKCA
jgi:tRNA(Ile)-lysidine synthase